MPEEKEIVNASEKELETTPAPEAAPEAPAPDAPESEEAGEGKEAAEYTPNTKYKFTDDKGESEAEFDEWVKPYLSKDSEEKFRDLYSRAKGLEYMKTSREKARQEKAALESQFGEFQSGVKEILDLKGKNLGLFLEKVGVSRQDMAKMVLEQLEAEEKLKDLPPHLQQMYTQNQELNRKVLELEKQFQQGTNFGLEQAANALGLQLQQILSRPEVASIAEQYDGRRGRPGAFFEQVKREGQLEHAMTGKDLTAAEAVQRALETLALQVQAPSQGATPNGSNAAPKTVVVTKDRVPTIPAVGNGTAAPTAKRVKSVDDLRRLAKEMQAQAS